MKTLPQNHRKSKSPTTSRGFFVDATLEPFVLKQPGKNREVRFLGKIFTPINIKRVRGLNGEGHNPKKAHQLKSDVPHSIVAGLREDFSTKRNSHSS